MQMLLPYGSGSHRSSCQIPQSPRPMKISLGPFQGSSPTMLELQNASKRYLKKAFTLARCHTKLQYVVVLGCFHQNASNSIPHSIEVNVVTFYQAFQPQSLAMPHQNPTKRISVRSRT